MPAYNAELYIRQAIESVLNSTLHDLELLVVNDGSTDKTGDILQEYAAKDNRVRVFNQANSGRPAFPKNIALQHACGDYVCFLDNDDYFSPDKIELMSAGLDCHPEWCAVFHDMKLVDANGIGMGKSYLKDANFLEKSADWLTPTGENWYDCGKDFFVFQSLYYTAIHTQSFMVARHRVPWENVRFDTKFAISDDADLWLRIGLMGRVGYLDKILSYYRQHGSNLTHLAHKKIVCAEDLVRVHEQNYPRVAGFFTQNELILYRKKIANTWRELGYLHYRANCPRLATRAYVKSACWAQPLKTIMPIAKAWLRPLLPQRY